MHTEELVCAAPAVEYLPIPQLVHTEGLVCATAAPAVEYWPGPQALQLTCPAASLNLPAWQSAHTDEVVCAAPAAEYLPILQLVHTEGLVCATAAPAVEYWPGPQALQLVCPAASPNWPAGQSAQSWKQTHGYPYEPHELPLKEFQ